MLKISYMRNYKKYVKGNYLKNENSDRYLIYI